MRVDDALKGSLAPNDGEILLSRVLRCDRSWLFAHPEQELSKNEEERFLSFRARRAAGEPVAYILGEKEFFGRTFFVDSSVLIPRPSTEALVEETLAFLQHPHDAVRDVESSVVVWARTQRDEAARCIVDVGTGSGIIACTLALETDMRVIATDVSESAVRVARRNIAKHEVEKRVETREGSLLEPVQKIDEPFLLVSNPPYVPAGFPLSGDTLFEPKQALFGGEDGGDIVSELTRQAADHPRCVGWVIECRPEHVER